MPKILLEKVQTVTQLDAVLQVLDVLLREDLRTPLPLLQVGIFGARVARGDLGHLMIDKLRHVVGCAVLD